MGHDSRKDEVLWDGYEFLLRSDVEFRAAAGTMPV
jgi:hypothetical protein